MVPANSRRPVVQVGNKRLPVGDDDLCLAQNEFGSIICNHAFALTLSPPLNEAKIGGFGGLQFLEKGDEGIAASSCINHFVQNFTKNQMMKSAMF